MSENRKKTTVFDGHNDLLLALAQPGVDRSFFAKSDIGHLDLPRIIEGGFGGGFFAIFVPPGPPPLFNPIIKPIIVDSVHTLPPFPAIDNSYAIKFTNTLIGSLFDIEQKSDGAFKIVHNETELRNCLQNGIVAAVLHFEGAEAITKNLDNLQDYYDQGLRSLGMVWSRPNDFAEGVPFSWPNSPDIGSGLTKAGKELVAACNNLGIIIDLSHLNEKGFWDVASLTSAPLIVSHSACHTICRTSRNLTDKQIDAVGESGGVIGVNFHVGDLVEGGWKKPETPMHHIANHIEHIAKRIGVEHVAFGSDFDGAMVPDEIKDVSGLPRLIQLLGDRGFDKNSIEKIACGNWQRVIKASWK